MSRSDWLWGAAATALSLCFGSSALAELQALGGASAGAHTDSDQGTTLLTPGPGSLTITAGAAASDGVSNPNPPPASWEMEAIADGIGTARYGSLAGRAHAEASALPAGPYLAGGQVTVNPGFTDGAEVVSDTLDPGTPVTLTFLMTLEASAIHFTDTDAINPQGTGAAARLELEVRDVDDIQQPSGEGALVINSRGFEETSRMVEFDTAIGHRLEIIAGLFVSAGAVIDYPNLLFTQASADVIADQTGELFHQPSGDVRLVSDSGHDYAAPEPGRGTLLAMCAALVLLRGRPRSS